MRPADSWIQRSTRAIGTLVIPATALGSAAARWEKVAIPASMSRRAKTGPIPGICVRSSGSTETGLSTGSGGRVKVGGSGSRVNVSVTNRSRMAQAIAPTPRRGRVGGRVCVLSCWISPSSVRTGSNAANHHLNRPARRQRQRWNLDRRCRRR